MMFWLWVAAHLREIVAFVAGLLVTAIVVTVIACR